jgi:hypothetical protein
MMLDMGGPFPNACAERPARQFCAVQACEIREYSVVYEPDENRPVTSPSATLAVTGAEPDENISTASPAVVSARNSGAEPDENNAVASPIIQSVADGALPEENISTPTPLCSALMSDEAIAKVVLRWAVMNEIPFHLWVEVPERLPVSLGITRRKSLYGSIFDELFTLEINQNP